MNKLVAMTTIALATASLASTALAAGGRIAAVEGIAEVRQEQQTLVAERGTLVLPGASVLTGSNSKVQLWMEDDGMLALAPDTSLVIRRFDVSMRDAVYELKSGGYRAVSGLIEHRATTPVADIDVMGTDYTAIICAAGCGSPPGLYVRVDSGVVGVGNAKGRLEVKPGQVVYVRSREDAPALAPDGETVFIALTADFRWVDVDIEGSFRIEPLPELPGSPS